MIFNSLNYILFLLVTILIYYSISSNRWRKLFLLIASYYFYACWNITFLFILLTVTVISFLLGVYFAHHKNKRALAFGILSLLLPLLCFKYLNFIFQSVNDIIKLIGIDISLPIVNIMQPIGISFFTFMAIGYVIDCYKNKYKPERNFLDYAIFLGFFPQISSGPIARGDQLIPQFKEKKLLSYNNFFIGAKMMLWGFFMKLVVGDRAGIYVDTIFSNCDSHSGITLLVATFMYSIQIYCDFAGYSLIAIGSARIMGYKLMTNFLRPYFATSVSDFWRRWHISLSSWFRDYVYIPLGGNRCGKLKQYFNLMVTFLVSGLWHGAAWNFVLWGGYHAICQIVVKYTTPIRSIFWNKFTSKIIIQIRNLTNIIFTFIVVNYLWMIFRTPTFEQVKNITLGYFRKGELYLDKTTMMFFAIGFIILLIKDFKDEFYPQKHYFLESKFIVVRLFSFAILAVIIVFIGILGGGQFIYFQF